MSEIISFEQVLQVVKGLQAKGLKASVRRVRGELSGGSFSVIGPLVRRAVQTLSSEDSLTAIGGEVPEDVAEVSQRHTAVLWGLMTARFEEQLGAIAAAHDRQVKELEEERQEAYELADRLQAEVDKLEAKKAELWELAETARIESRLNKEAAEISSKKSANWMNRAIEAEKALAVHAPHTVPAEGSSVPPKSGKRKGLNGNGEVSRFPSPKGAKLDAAESPPETAA